MIDSGSHPMYLINWFLGMPKYVSSVFTSVTGRPVEDNAVSLLQYKDGAIGVAETGSVSVADPYTIVISGTKGYLRISGGKLSYSCPATDNKKVTLTEFNTYCPDPLDYWLDSIVNNTSNEKFGIDEAVALTEIMAAAYKSAQSKKKIKV